MSDTLDNRQWKVARSPARGWPTGGDFKFTTNKALEPDENQVSTKTIYLSMDPYQWIRLRAGVEKTGDICHGRTVSQVIKTRNKAFQEGDFIFNTNGWQDFGLVGKNISVFDYMIPRKLDPSIAPISTAVGALGMLGLTAYAGVYLQCQPQRGETVVVSAASGGVGQIAGQIAKIKGCRVVGIAGSDEKCQLITGTFGFDAAVNYKREDFADQLTDACPDGVDIYFENVGGVVFEAVKPLLNKNSRITLCGLISQYDKEIGRDQYDSKGVVNALDHAHKMWTQAGAAIFTKQDVSVHTLAVPDFVKDYEAKFLSEMGGWIKDGLVKYKEDMWQGLEKSPEAFSAMLSGKNFGKTLVQVSEDTSIDS